jgi:hypothetical protein
VRILCLCDEGNNRSVVVAHQLKYLGHDCLSAGLSRNGADTLAMLYEWADHIITTDASQLVPAEHQAKVRLWNIGPDRYPRPFNKELLTIVRDFVQRERGTLKTETRAA